MSIEVFNRHENKYQIDDRVFTALQIKLSDYMEADSFNKKHLTYHICNIYYDTDDSYLIRTSLSKPKYKEKLRLRSYGTPDENSTVYAEIKKKYRGVVNKRRSALKLHEAYELLDTGKLPQLQPHMNGQVLREIQYLLSQRTLKPAVYLSYERRAFFGAGDSDLRVSFDTNITTRRDDLRLESGIYGKTLLGGGQWLMEIKTSRAIPLWLTRLLSEYSVYPSSFSKYGAEYKSTLVPAPEKRVIIPGFTRAPLLPQALQEV